jgi:hypothetical protein
MLGLDAPATIGRSAWIASGLLAAVLSATTIGAQAPAGGQAPAQQAAPVTRTFGPDAGFVLHFIKPESTADFEMVMAKVKEVLQKSTKPERKQQATGWKLFKSQDPPGPKGEILYVFIIDPALKGADYQVSNILAEGLPVAEVNELFKKYAASYGQGQQPVNLALVNDFGK